MKLRHLLLCMLPFAGFSQKVKVNEYDKFIRQKRVELEPLKLFLSDKADISLNLSATGSSLHLFLSGYGWGAPTIDNGNEMIFLFSNDSTISVRSTGFQAYETGDLRRTYKHQYTIAFPDIEALSQYDLVGIRKYGFTEYSDLKITKEQAARIQKMGQVFINELRKAKIVHTLKRINLQDIRNFIGDSVMFCSKVYRTRYFEASENKPTLLDVNPDYSNQPVSIIIWEKERKNFHGAPEVLYENRDVCISGVVQLQNNAPQIIIHRKEQIKVTSPVDVTEIASFTGDSVTVVGKIFAGKIVSNPQSSTMFLDMGAAYPDQLLTVVLETKEKADLLNLPEDYYTNKKISVTGKVVFNRDKPQIFLNNKDQIKEITNEALASTAPDATYAKMQTGAKSSLAASPPSGHKLPSYKSNPVAEVNANFPGGDKALVRFLKKNLSGPPGLLVGEKVTVLVNFLVDTAGNIKDIKILKSAGKAYDKEVIRVLNKMPKWIPQMRNGVPVETRLTQPVTFTGVDEKNME